MLTLITVHREPAVAEIIADSLVCGHGGSIDEISSNATEVVLGEVPEAELLSFLSRFMCAALTVRYIHN